MKFVRTAALLVAAGAALACAAPSSSNSSSPRPAVSRTVIMNDAMLSAQATNLYEAVERIHPEWLRQRNGATMAAMGATRGSGSADVQVFVDGQHVGGPEMLRQMPVSTAGSLHYYTAAEAENKFGTGYPNGVIQVLPPGKS